MTVKVKVAQSYLTLCDAKDCSPPGSSVYGDSPGKNAGVGCHALLQGIFPAQGWNLGVLHCRRPGFACWVRKIPWRRAWQPTPAFLPGESHGQRSLVGYHPWGRKESDATDTFPFKSRCSPRGWYQGAWDLGGGILLKPGPGVTGG